MNDLDSAGQKRAAPPYVSFPSFKNMIGGFKAVGRPPGRIDRTVLGNFSGAVGSQLLTALRFFSLIDDEGHPREALGRLVEAHGTEQWSEKLAALLRHAYGPVFDLNLENASPGQFSERFKSAYPIDGETLRKCQTFFLHAAKDAQVPVSNFIIKNKKPRAANGSRKPRAARTSGSGNSASSSSKEAFVSADSNQGNHGSGHNRPGTDVDAFKRDLLDKFPAFDPSWPDEIKANWFAGFNQFMEMAKK